MEAMKNLRVRVTLTEEMLGMCCSEPDIHEEYIASKAPNAPSTAEEVEALGVEEVVAKGKTVFPRDGEGRPILWDYQIKGLLKDACGMLRKVPGSACSKVKAYKKEIDGLIFVAPRKIPITLPPGGEISDCQRPLRAQTAQGERVALANSETVPAGSTIEFTIDLLCAAHEAFVRECLNYGALRGLGQWRNSGKGKFEWEEME